MSGICASVLGNERIKSNDSEKYHITVGPHYAADKWPDRLSLPWPHMARMLTDHRPGPKVGECFTPATFLGLRRCQTEAEQIGVAALDLDHGDLTLQKIKSRLQWHSWGAAIHSTYRHTSNQPRYRIVVPLSAPWYHRDYATQEAACRAWRSRVMALAAALGVDADAACTDASRAFLLPRHPSGAAWEAEVVEGRPCDVWSLPDAPGYAQEPEPIPMTLPAFRSDTHLARYVGAALYGEARIVRSASEGNRHYSLLIASIKLGTLVGAGVLDPELVRAHLVAAALECGLPRWEIDRTVTDGLRYGLARPRKLPQTNVVMK